MLQFLPRRSINWINPHIWLQVIYSFLYVKKTIDDCYSIVMISRS